MITVWQSMSGRSQDLMVAGALKYAIPVVAYGIYKLITLGVSPEFYFYTYIPAVVGPILIAAAVVFINLAGAAEKRPERIFPTALYILLIGAIAFYETVFLGVSQFLRGMRPIDAVSIVGGIFWILVGLRLLRKCYVITILMAVPMGSQDIRKLLLKDGGIKPKELRHPLLDENVGKALGQELFGEPT